MQSDNINTSASDQEEEINVEHYNNGEPLINANEQEIQEKKLDEEEIVNIEDVEDEIPDEIIDIITVEAEDDPLPPSLPSPPPPPFFKQDDLSLNEKCEIASKLLQQCPPGERSEVLNDIIDIIDDQEVLPLLETIIRNCNISSFLPIKIDDSDDYLILSPSIYKGNNIFVNPKTLAEYEVNPFTLESTLIKPKQQDVESFLLREKIEQFVLETFSSTKKGGESFCQISQNSTENEIIICAQKFNPSNMINGQWKSIWKIGQEEITAKIDVLVHFWEDSNVQLHGSRSFKGRTPSGGNEVDDIIAIIKKEENEFQLSLNESYSNLLEKSFKRLRRTLPVTRSKIDWPKLVCSRTSEHLPSAGGGGP